MSLFPIVQDPCPYKGRLSDILDGSLCRLCKREVVDISDYTDSERRALLQRCDGELCVSYKVDARSAIAALALGAAAMAAPAAAQPVSPVSAPTATSAEDIIIIVGGMRAPKRARWASADVKSALRPLPIIVEDAPDRSPLPEDLRPAASVAGRGT